MKKSVQIYLYPYSEPERMLLDVWASAAKSTGRAQDVFRNMLRAGLKTMVEQGTLPYNIILDCDLERRLGVRTGSAGAPTMVFAHPHMMMPAPEPIASVPASHAAPQRTIDMDHDDTAPEPPPAAVDPEGMDPTDAILSLMGSGSKR